MSTRAYRVMAKLVEASNYSNAYEAAMMLCIGLKIGVIQHDDMVVAETAKYLVKEELKEYGGDPYPATRMAIARIANKVLNDLENDSFQLETDNG